MKKILLLSAFLLAACSNQQDFKSLSESVQGEPSFIFSSDLHCEIVVSTEKDDKGKIFTLIGLDTDKPRALFASGTDSPMKVIHQDDDAITVQLVAVSGSIDTITLNKKTGVFARASIGNFIGTYVAAFKGSCK